MSTSEREFLSTRKLAMRWGISVQTLRNWRGTGQGPPFFQPSGLGGKVFYRITDLEEWERDHTRGAARELRGKVDRL